MNAVTTVEGRALSTKPTGDFSPQTFEQALTFSQYLADSDMVPKDFKGKPGNCLIAMQWGAEVGLKPLQALQNIAVISGRPSMWGDAVLALVRSSPLCEYVLEDDDNGTAVCRAKRRGEPEQIRTFSDADAKTAGLAGKPGPWVTNPKRMKQMRARAFALRDVFTDVLKGIAIAEEVMDIPAEKHMGAADVVAAPPPPAQAVWPDDAFTAQYERWAKAIAAGLKSHDEIIALAKSKGELTVDQINRIRSLPLPKPAADALPTEGEQS